MKVLKIFGPPGTGKTHRLLDLLEQELKSGVHPDRIAFLTFTTAARREAVARAKDVLDLDDDDLPWFRTLHSVAYRALGINRQGLVAKAKDLEPFGEMMGLEFSRGQAGEGQLSFGGSQDGDRFLAFDHFRRHRKMDLETAYRQWPDPMRWFDIKRFSEGYVTWKEREALYDFTDLLEHTDTSLPIDVVFVDEAQDLSTLQWDVLDQFAAEAKRMYIAGDDDQAIFEWAGADPRAFIARSGEVQVLEQSYRLPRTVHALAQDLAIRLEHRQAKLWRPRRYEGEVNRVIAPRHYDYPSDTLVLYRHHYLAREIEEELRRLGRPYKFHDRPAPGLEMARVIGAYESVRKGGTVSSSLGRQMLKVLGVNLIGLNIPDQSGWDTLSCHSQASAMSTNVPWFDAFVKMPREHIDYVRRLLQNHGNSGLYNSDVTLSTIHASKGAEADHVLLLTDKSRRVQQTIARNPDPERRVFYVGITRARRTLTISGADHAVF